MQQGEDAKFVHRAAHLVGGGQLGYQSNLMQRYPGQPIQQYRYRLVGPPVVVFVIP